MQKYIVFERMSGKLYRDDDGIWKSDFNLATPNGYWESLLNYLNVLDPFFSKAKETCNFEFIFCLIRYTGMRDAGWDPFENLLEIYKGFQRIHAMKIQDRVKAHYALFMYGLILEASMPYELLANLMNVIEGERYIVQNFKDHVNPKTGRKRSISPSDKIAQLKSRARKLNLNLDLFDEFFDNGLRNGIFHSDYSIYWPEVRIRNPDKKYKHTEWMNLVNKSFAYLSALDHLYYGYISTYSEPELVDPHPEFPYPPNGKVTTIVREGYGLVGIKDNWTKEELAKGYIPHRLGHFLAYEIPLIEKGFLKLPPNKIEKFNNRLKFCPPFLRSYIVKKFAPKYGIRLPI